MEKSVISPGLAQWQKDQLIQRLPQLNETWMEACGQNMYRLKSKSSPLSTKKQFEQPKAITQKSNLTQYDALCSEETLCMVQISYAPHPMPLYNI